MFFSLPKEKSVGDGAAAFSPTDFSPSLTEKLMGLRRHFGGGGVLRFPKTDAA